MAGNGEQFERERAELQRVLSSDLFRRSKSHKSILKYVCCAYFDGQADGLKEYIIAVEALGRPESFDHRKDSIVRVEFHKLRKRLQQYYRDDSSVHDFVIEIPPGRYAPRFNPPNEAPVRQPTSLIAAPFQLTISFPRFFWIAVLGVAALAALTGIVGDRYGDRDRLPASPGPELIHRISVGGLRTIYVDDAGAAWGPDADAAFGGEVIVDDSIAVAGTHSPIIYRSRREGAFSYRLDLGPGLYELRLYFAETAFGPGNPGGLEKVHGEGSRVFHVDANGVRILEDFDILADAGGPNTPVEKVIAGLSPGPDGAILLDFVPVTDNPILNALEVYRTLDARMRPVRLLAGRSTPLLDNNGREWGPDRYVAGGRSVPRQNRVSGADYANLFAGERYGRFRYTIPVDSRGSFTARLFFAETWWGALAGQERGDGSRLFDVLCNGVKLLTTFDIHREAGGPNKALIKEFRGLKPTPHGTIELSFVPIENYAALNALEIIQE